MGLAIDQVEFSEQDYQRFSVRLRDCLDCLEQVLDDPDFGGDSKSWGAELELYVVGEDGNVRLLNEAIVERHGDPLLNPGIESFQSGVQSGAGVWWRSTIQHAAGSARSRDCTRWAETASSLGVQDRAGGYFAHFAKIRHWSTLHDAIAALSRAHPWPEGPGQRCVSRCIFTGDPPLQMVAGGCHPGRRQYVIPVSLSGSQPRFCPRSFNAFLLATPILAGVSAANSPTLFGHRLWHETRVPSVQAFYR